MPPKKANKRSLANLRNQPKLLEPAPEEPANTNLDDLELATKNHLDSTKPQWDEQETDEEEAKKLGIEEAEVLEDENNEFWGGEKLVKNGIYKEVYEAAINGEMCTYLGDGDDPDDEDYLTIREKNYATGPDISRKAARTQRTYKKAWATQTTLDGFITQKQQVTEPKPGLSRLNETAPIKVEDSDQMDVEPDLSFVATASETDVPIRQESPDIDLHSLDPPIRQESLTPPPLPWDNEPDEDNLSHLNSSHTASQEDQVPRRKRRASMEVEEIEDEDAPGACFHSSPDEYVDLNVDPDTGVECWEEELHETRAHPTEIRGWAELRDQINDDLKKKFKTFTPSQVNQLIILRSFATLRLRSVGKLKASEQIALQWQDDVNGSAAHFARRIRALASHYQVNEQLPIEKCGGYKNARSILKEESVRTAARTWLTSQKVGSITPTKFCNGLNTEILPGLGISLKSPFCTKTALRWLVKLRWMKTTLKKGVYMDGHERKDVINYRQMVYLPKIAEYQNQMAKYKGPELKKIEPNLKDGEKEIIAVFQDESCCHANEFQTTAWMRPGVDQILQRKGRGRLIHISDFILESTGRLVVLNEDGSVKREARKIIYPGSGGDPYWDKNQLLAQVKNAAIPVFEEANPGKQALFIFDQSSAHAALPDNALRAFEMNKSNGGAQRTQRDT
ncbi:hypothetical protein M422DRAFT_239552, partial [Sphaerobolus stellatus SS14]